MSLLAIELQHFPISNEPLEMVVLVDGITGGGTAREEEVSRAEGPETGDIGDDLIDLEEHVGRTALLHRPAVDVEVEGQVLQVEELVLRDPFADGCGAVEALAEVPGLSGGFGLLLALPGREVDADSHGGRSAGESSCRGGRSSRRPPPHTLSARGHRG